MAHQMVTVQGLATSPVPGRRMRGFIEPTSRVVDLEGDSVGLRTVRFTVEDGEVFSVQVPATDSEHVVPQGFTYRLGLRVEGRALLEVMPEVIFQAPAANPVIDLSDLVPVGVPAEPLQYTALSQRMASLEASPGGSADLAAHVASATPHPAYDTDLQDLTILFENGMA